MADKEAISAFTLTDFFMKNKWDPLYSGTPAQNLKTFFLF